MIKEEIIKRLEEDSVLLTRIAARLEKPFPTVKSWVQRKSSRLQEYPFLQVLSELLEVDIPELMN